MSVYRPHQGALQRITPNAGNRRVVRGGTRGKVTPHAEQQLELALEPERAKRTKKGGK